MKNNIKFKYVTVCIIGNNGNLSVGAPFCRECPFKIIQITDNNTRIELYSLGLEELEALKQINKINTLKKFNELYDKLNSAITAKLLGKKEDKELMNKLYSMRARIDNDLTQQQKIDFSKKFTELSKGPLGWFDIGRCAVKK